MVRDVGTVSGWEWLDRSEGESGEAVSFWSITILGGRGWTEPAKETPVRSTRSAQIQVKRPHYVPGFHSCLAPTPATHLFTASTAVAASIRQELPRMPRAL